MTTPALILRHLCFTGPEKQSAKLEFGAGLNVIYGSSDTGKSFMLEAIDFMLGGTKELRDIPERVGYDRVFLGLETSVDGKAYTLARAANGGQFQLYEGLHESVPANIEATILGVGPGATKTSTVSRFLLGKVGLDGKRVRTNAKNETRNLSFRDLCRLSLVSETDIQKQGSPLETGQYLFKTVEYSIFKLLLTGVDDSATVSTARDVAVSQSRAAKVDFVGELIASYRQKVEESEQDPQELASQLERLASTIEREQQALRASEDRYQALLDRRSKLRQRRDNGAERRAEIDELRARFSLLDEHYRSDLARLEAIREAGSLVAALPPHTCPLCGAAPEQQNRDDDGDGNLENVVAAAHAESEKIVRLRRELAETVRQLGLEAQSFDRLIPRLAGDLDKLEDEMQELRPSVSERRTTYSDLLEKRSSVSAVVTLFEQLADLEARKQALEHTPETDASVEASTDLSSTTLDAFAQQVEALLKQWDFPEPERVHFDVADRDLVIQGKRRSSRGKGMRAVTHAAFTLALMEFCKAHKRQHPGFVILDSPLLAYRAPEGPEDDLTGTDVQDKFYEYLAKTEQRQVIIIENIDPPATISARPSTHFFNKNPHHGRYGFFPPLASTVA